MTFHLGTAHLGQDRRRFDQGKKNANFLVFVFSLHYLCTHISVKIMELKCPQCGKWMAVSQEELVIHDCQVVCPQCLAICHYEGGVLVARDDSDAPYRHTASVSVSQQDQSKFCHSCGKKLPSGISFCPYCGADLNAPFYEPKPEPVPSQPEPEVKPEEPQEPKPAPVEERPKQEAAKPHKTSHHVEDKLRTVARHYTGAHPHLHQNGTQPGTAFKIIAYTIIALLLALLVYIIIAGASIEMPA